MPTDLLRVHGSAQTSPKIVITSAFNWGSPTEVILQPDFIWANSNVFLVCHLFSWCLAPAGVSGEAA